jgi:hypothetical protein
MRTKTLLCLAALTAGVATSMAQSNVYSLNIVGYASYTQLPGKYNLISNPLNQTNNDVQYLFPNAASYPGLAVYKRSLAGYLQAFYDPDNGGWGGDYPMAIAPGEGFWLQSPAGITYSNTFVGEVVLNSTNPIPHGYALKASVVPQVGDLTAQPGFPLGANVGDSVYFFNGNGYNQYTFDPDNGGWNLNGTPGNPATTSVVQGYWTQNQGANTNWVRNFTVGP